VAGSGAWGDDVAAVRADVDLPGKGPTGAGADGGLPLVVAGGAVPDVKAPGRRSYTQGPGVVGGALLPAKGSEYGEGVEAVREPCEVDMVADGDAGENPVTGWRFGIMGVDVDDDQAGWAAGDADPEVRMSSPPLLNAVLVEGGRVEAVAPAACA
jgi:hypothetical protein